MIPVKVLGGYPMLAEVLHYQAEESTTFDDPGGPEEWEIELYDATGRHHLPQVEDALKPHQWEEIKDHIRDYWQRQDEAFQEDMVMRNWFGTAWPDEGQDIPPRRWPLTSTRRVEDV